MTGNSVKKSIYPLLIGMALFTTLLLTACFAAPAQDMEEYERQIITLPACTCSGMTERPLIMHRSFEDAVQSANTIVLVEYVTHRPFGRALTEFEFIVHERIFGTAADRIFVYIERELSCGEEVWTTTGHEMPSFNTGAKYILLLSKITSPVRNTHEDGFQFFHNVIIDLNNPSESTMFGAPLAHSATGINFNARNLSRGHIMSYMAKLSRNNTPAREFIRSDVLEDIVLGSRYVVVADISSIHRLSSHRSDWSSTDIFYVTIVQALKGYMMPGQQVRQVFHADTVQLGERHLVAIEPASEPGPFLHILSSRHSLLRMDQLDEVSDILGRAPPDLD